MCEFLRISFVVFRFSIRFSWPFVIWCLSTSVATFDLSAGRLVRDFVFFLSSTDLMNIMIFERRESRNFHFVRGFKWEIWRSFWSKSSVRIIWIFWRIFDRCRRRFRYFYLKYGSARVQQSKPKKIYFKAKVTKYAKREEKSQSPTYFVVVKIHSNV